MSTNRRTFLKALVGLALFVVPAAGMGYRYRRRLLRRYAELSLDESSGKGMLSREEFQVIRAVFEVISPKPPPPSQEFLEFVNARTSGVPGYYREYKEAVALFESRAHRQFGRGFAALGEESRQEMLREILLQRTSPTPRTVIDRKIQTAFRTLFFRAERRFKEFVFPDLVMFYWSSSAGWAAVGYNSRPGIPDVDPRAYTSAPDLT